MSDSDDSDDSGLPFDVEIEKCEKRLQLARYKKKYRNAWGYVTKFKALPSGGKLVLSSMEDHLPIPARLFDENDFHDFMD